MLASVPGLLQRTFWSLIGRMWAEQSPTAPHVRQVVSLVQERLDCAEARLIDVGCGAGLYSVALAQAGFVVTGVDAAGGMLAEARKALPGDLAARVSFDQGDLDARLAYPDASFDAAVAISVLQATRSPAHASREILRLLKPGGYLVVLHFPRQDYHSHSLWQQVRDRLALLKRKTLRNRILAAVKVIAEQSGGSRYWSVGELHNLLTNQGYQIESTPSNNPIVLVARRP